MSPGGNNDLQFDVNVANAVRDLRAMEKAWQATQKGVAGAVDAFQAAYDKHTRAITSLSDKANVAQERYVKNLERAGALAGKSGAERINIQFDREINQLKKAGDAYGQLEDRIRRVNKVRQQMLDADKSGGGGGSGAGFNTTTAFRASRDLFEGRTAYAEVAFSKMIQDLSGLPFVLGAGAAAFIGLETASFKAAKAVGEYAEHVHQAQLITGMSAREVQQFDYAAKVTGQDASILDRMMRGLTQAIDDTSTSGKRGQEVLQRMGVDMIGLRTGSVSTMDLFKQVSASLEAQGGLWTRNAEAIALFKRAGISSLPMLVELNQNLRDSRDIRFMSDEKIKEFEEMHRQIEKVGAEFDQFILRLKAAAAQPFIITLNLVKGEKGGNLSALNDILNGDIAEGFGKAAKYWFGDTGPATELAAEIRKRNTSAGLPLVGSPSRDTFLAQQRRTDPEAAQSHANDLKKIYDEARTQLTHYDSTLKTEVINTADYIKQTGEAYTKANDQAKLLLKTQSDIKAVAEAMRKQVVDASERAAHPYGMLPAESRLKSILELPNIRDDQKAEARRVAAPEIRREVEDILRRSGLKVDASGQIQHTDMLVKAAQGYTVSPTGIDVKRDSNADIRALQEQIKELDKDDREFIKITEGVLSVSRKSEEQSALNRVRIASTLSADTPQNRLAAEQQVLQIKKQAVAEEYTDAVAKIADEYGDKTNREKAYLELRLRYTAEVNEAQAQFDQQRATEIRKQFDEIKSKTEGLLHTLFTNPKGFGSQLATTIRDAALKPIESGLASMISSTIQPLVGRIGGMFGGSTRQVAIDGGGAALVRVVNLGSSGPGGSAGTSIFSSGGFSSGGGTYSNGSGGSGFGGFGGGSSPSLFGTSSITGGPGGTGGFVPGSLGLDGGGGGGSATGGGFNLGGLTGGLSGLKSASGFGNIVSIGERPFAIGADGSLTNISGFGGKIEAFGKSGMGRMGAGIAGNFLVQRGLLGSDRGSFGGLLEGTAGGAALGFSIAPPGFQGLGALIGAAAGFGIGLGEIIAGVETPEKEAKRLVKQLYRVDIDTSTAKQIVQIAQGQYGGHVSIAVRSPEVRNLIMLYSQSTGQGNLLSGTVPRAGSLMESGGTLFQSASYANGSPYAYQSSLPIAGGFNANAWPGSNAGAPTINGLQLFIGGQGAGQFMAGQVVTPEFVQSQVSNAYGSSNNRVATSALLNTPGLITG